MEDTQNMSESTPETLANEMSQPGKFSLIERLQNRNMPKDTIDIYLDEAGAYERRTILDELDGEKRFGAKVDTDSIARLEAKLAEVEARIRESVARVHMTGISSAKYDALLLKAATAFPSEYDETTSPLTGQKTRVEKPNEDRDVLFNSLFISASIDKVTIGNEEDTDITPEWWEQFKGIAPIDALRLIVEAAYKMRMTVAWMDEIQNEDF